VNGDYYLNTTNGDVYTKAGGVWGAPVTNIKGAAGANGTNGTNGTNGAAGTPGSVWYEGAGAPGVGTGVNGDYYLNTTTNDVYTKTGGAWGSPIANLAGQGNDLPITGANFTDTNTTINPASLGQSRFVMPAGTCSAPRMITLGTTGSILTNETVWLRINPQSFSITVRNGGVGGTVVPDTVVPALAMSVDVVYSYDGTNWRPTNVVRVV
jgi:hypothetical protein